jgi:S1-C subfamily serine protease
MTNFSELSIQMANAVEAAAASVLTVHGARPVSGTVVGPEQVLTVAHVLPADEVTVRTPDGRELTGMVAGRDPSSDLALVRVEGLGLPALGAGGSVRVGELLLAVGRPPHGTQATLGLLERAAPERGWLPSGAAPFRGVSGGALVDARGGLVGVLNAGIRRGTLLAVPAARALQVAELLASTGRVPRGFLGIATQPVHFPEMGGTDAEAQRDRSGRRGRWGGRMGPGRVGLTAVQIEDGSPAQSAGLRVGDVLLALDSESIRHPRELLDRVRERAGQDIVLRVLRGGEESDVAVTVGER